MYNTVLDMSTCLSISVCPSVPHMLVLSQSDTSQDREVFTDGDGVLSETEV